MHIRNIFSCLQEYEQKQNQNYNIFSKHNNPLMNRIKIVNEDILNLMQNSMKQYRVVAEPGPKNDYFKPLSIDKLNGGPANRPKTPQEVFKSVIKQSVAANQQISRDRYRRQKKDHSLSRFHDRGIYTSNEKYRQDSQLLRDSEEPFVPAVVQKKFENSQFIRSRVRPMTTENFAIRNKKNKNQKIQHKDDIQFLKHDIDQVLDQIRQENQLQKRRMKTKYAHYGLKKFGKFWNMHNVNLNKKSFMFENNRQQSKEQVRSQLRPKTSVQRGYVKEQSSNSNYNNKTKIQRREINTLFKQ